MKKYIFIFIFILSIFTLSLNNDIIKYEKIGGNAGASCSCGYAYSDNYYLIGRTDSISGDIKIKFNESGFLFPDSFIMKVNQNAGISSPFIFGGNGTDVLYDCVKFNNKIICVGYTSSMDGDINPKENAKNIGTYSLLNKKDRKQFFDLKQIYKGWLVEYDILNNKITKSILFNEFYSIYNVINNSQKNLIIIGWQPIDKEENGIKKDINNYYLLELNEKYKIINYYLIPNEVGFVMNLFEANGKYYLFFYKDIIVLDKNFKLVTQKKYSADKGIGVLNSYWDEKNQQFVVIGETESTKVEGFNIKNNAKESKYFNIILDKNLNAKSVSYFNINKLVKLNKIVKYKDNYLIIGNYLKKYFKSAEMEYSEHDIILIMMDKNGKIIKYETYGGYADDIGKDIFINNNNTITIIGECDSETKDDVFNQTKEYIPSTEEGDLLFQDILLITIKAW